jgi:c(7)-type cytochrome triheme protein
VAIQTKDVGTIPFSHAEHGRMFACDECHPDTFKAQANVIRTPLRPRPTVIRSA